MSISSGSSIQVFYRHVLLSFDECVNFLFPVVNCILLIYREGAKVFVLRKKILMINGSYDVFVVSQYFFIFNC